MSLCFFHFGRDDCSLLLPTWKASKFPELLTQYLKVAIKTRLHTGFSFSGPSVNLESVGRSYHDRELLFVQAWRVCSKFCGLQLHTSRPGGKVVDTTGVGLPVL